LDPEADRLYGDGIQLLLERVTCIGQLEWASHHHGFHNQIVVGLESSLRVVEECCDKAAISVPIHEDQQF
jgi:hypothetical protein